VLFRKAQDARRIEASRRLKALARHLFGANEDDAIVVNELRCTEPGCPPIETVVALLRQGAPTRQVKVHKPIADVTDDDLRDAFAHGHEHHE
jgi:hypothetical protein